MKKICRCGVVFVFAAGVFSGGGISEASSENEAKDFFDMAAREEIAEPVRSDSEDVDDIIVEKDINSDDWFFKSPGEAVDEKEAKKRERFIEILRDESFIYRMDRDTARLTNIPHTTEKMIDVWVKLEPAYAPAGDYTYPQKYYLEHYYIRPKTQQIQFIAEIEVAGRPTNDINEKRYDPARWESLVPGSIEDSVYHAVLKHRGKIKKDAVGESGSSLRDFMDRTFNIGL